MWGLMLALINGMRNYRTKFVTYGQQTVVSQNAISFKQLFIITAILYILKIANLLKRIIL